MEPHTWHVLIVEDDQRLAELTSDYLQNNGLSVAIEGNGARAAARIIDEQPDLVILDLMLPGEDGFSICRSVRDRYDGPILMLTARTDDTDHIQGLDTGADDFVCKPVHPRVLLARIKALLRRSEAPQVPAAELRRLVFGPLVVDNLAARAKHRTDRCRVRSALAAGRQCRAHIVPRRDFHGAARHRLRRAGSLDRCPYLAHPPQDRRRSHSSASDQDRAQQGLPVCARSGAGHERPRVQRLT